MSLIGSPSAARPFEYNGGIETEQPRQTLISFRPAGFASRAVDRAAGERRGHARVGRGGDRMRGLDVAARARICIKELYGDWYRDPWGWPEFHWVADNSN